MRLAVISLDFSPQVGGVQSYLYEMSQRLGASHEVVAVTPAEGPLPVQTTFAKVVLRGGRVIHFRRALRRLKPDVVLVGHAHPRLLLAAVSLPASRYAAIAYGNDYLVAQDCWHRPIFNALLRRASPLITIADTGAARLRKLANAAAAVVRPGTDPGRFHPRPGEGREGFRLLTVGRLVPRKGIDVVLRALALLRARFPDLRYEIVGEGPDRDRLGGLCDRLQLGPVVIFRGAVSDAELPDCYRRADAFVMPVHGVSGTHGIEGFGIVYLEASASGLPIVAARSGGAVEAVQDGETGLLVPPDDPDALSRALRQLVESEALRRRLGNAGRRWVETTMNWDRAARELEELLVGG